MEKISNAVKYLNELDFEKLSRWNQLELIGQFFKGFGHEISNDSTYTKAGIELLQRYWSIVLEKSNLREIENGQKLADNINEVLKASYSGLEKIQDSIDGIRYFTRMEKGKSGVVSIVEVLEECNKIIQSEIYETGAIFLNKVNNDGKFDVFGVRQQIKQLFVNIYSNALKAVSFNKNNRGKIETNVDYVESTGAVAVTIKDNGCGISKNILPEMFEPYFSGFGDGIGLGLYLANEIIKKHQGYIKVKSLEGKGSEFVIVFPKTCEE